MKLLKKMKGSAYLINTARGDIVVEKDLVRALKDQVIKGAGLDVYEKEPQEVENELLKLKNVFYYHILEVLQKKQERLWE